MLSSRQLWLVDSSPRPSKRSFLNRIRQDTVRRTASLKKNELRLRGIVPDVHTMPTTFHSLIVGWSLCHNISDLLFEGRGRCNSAYTLRAIKDLGAKYPTTFMGRSEEGKLSVSGGKARDWTSAAVVLGLNQTVSQIPALIDLRIKVRKRGSLWS